MILNKIIITYFIDIVMVWLKVKRSIGIILIENNTNVFNFVYYLA